MTESAPGTALPTAATRRPRGLHRWFIGGFLLTFVGMLLFFRTYALLPSGGGVVSCSLGRYYLIEIRSALASTGYLGPTTGSGWTAITTLLQHLLIASVGGALMLGIAFAVRRLQANRWLTLDSRRMKRLVLIGISIMLMWFCLAWLTDDWGWCASFQYATVGAVGVAFVVAACGERPYSTISLGFAMPSAVPLAYKLLAQPGRLFGYAVLPVDFSYHRRDLGDALTIWCIGLIGAFVAYYASRRLTATTAKRESRVRE